jgi:hypothetical protein
MLSWRYNIKSFQDFRRFGISCYKHTFPSGILVLARKYLKNTLFLRKIPSIQKACMEITCSKIRIAHQALVKRNRCFDAFNDEFV